jgi:uncharacterized OB-fold protein
MTQGIPSKQAIPPRPLPVVDEDTKPFWDYAKKHELRVQKCTKCGELHYPPSAICPHCLNLTSEWVKISGKGQVYSFIVVRRQYHPAFAKDLPYTVAIIETSEGLRLLSNVIDCKPDDVKIGMAVEVVFEDVSADFALPKFKPST